MSLFNFQNNDSEDDDDDFEGFESNEVSECFCEKCCQENTAQLVSDFTELILQAESGSEISEMLVDLIDQAKLDGIKEFLHHEIQTKTDTLNALADVKVFEIEYEYEDEDVNDNINVTLKIDNDGKAHFIKDDDDDDDIDFSKWEDRFNL